MRRQALLFVLLGFMALCFMTAQASQSGKCGDNVTWKLSSSGALTISGKGAMYDYDEASPFPAESVKTASIGSGITSIGDGATMSVRA